tara:strand:- start:1871 stop:2479 length:609 start_codon:yes stop_codon:yes gene_type:complete
MNNNALDTLAEHYYAQGQAQAIKAAGLTKEAKAGGLKRMLQGLGLGAGAAGGGGLYALRQAEGSFAAGQQRANEALARVQRAAAAEKAQAAEALASAEAQAARALAAEKAKSLQEGLEQGLAAPATGAGMLMPYLDRARGAASSLAESTGLRGLGELINRKPLYDPFARVNPSIPLPRPALPALEQQNFAEELSRLGSTFVQ